MTRLVVVRFQFEAIHSWPECPHDDVAFLRAPHRHMFHVEAKMHVNHNDRDVEFIMLKREMENYVQTVFAGDIGRKSCEDIAEELVEWFELHSCSVFEDGENGAEVIA